MKFLLAAVQVVVTSCRLIVVVLLLPSLCVENEHVSSCWAYSWTQSSYTTTARTRMSTERLTTTTTTTTTPPPFSSTFTRMMMIRPGCLSIPARRQPLQTHLQARFDDEEERGCVDHQDTDDDRHITDSRSDPPCPLSLSSTGASFSSRRQWMQNTLLGATSSLLPPILRPVGAAETAAITTTAPPTVVISPAVCDPSVSVWKLRDDSRLVYLLGTAHISELSANLAASLVRDVHPNAVFVELDLKRIGGIADALKREDDEREQKMKLLNPALTSSISDTEDAATLGDDVTVAEARKVTQVVVPVFASSSPSSSSASSSSSLAVAQSDGDDNTGSSGAPPSPPPLPPATDSAGTAAAARRPNNNGPIGWLQRKTLNFASTAVGNALKGMYENLNQAGFNPGEEFAAAIREARNIGASVVLGDQDVELTLRRLTQALASTDLNKLFSPESEFEKTMNELLPGGPNSLPPERSNYDDPAVFKRELAAYVEKLKSRDNVRKIISQLNEVAPALVQVMLTERDAYMARGLDTLDQFDCIVAVMGIAHQDGVERNLMDRGWTHVRLKCPKYSSNMLQ